MSKRQKDHTLSDIIRLIPKWWLDKQTDQAKAKDYLKHILTVMEAGNQHMAEYYFIDVFESYDISTFSLQLLNKWLMEHRHETRRTIPQSTLTPVPTRLALVSPDNLRNAIKPNNLQLKNEIDQQHRVLRDLKRNVEDYERQIKEYRMYMHDSLRSIVTAEILVDALELRAEQGTGAVCPDRMKLIRSIPSQWVLLAMGTDEFTVIRRTPITITHINAGSGMCKTLYLGFMGLKFNWNMVCVGSFHVADYIAHSTERVHPHVAGSHICFGNVQRRAETLATSKQYTEYWQLLETVLTTFSPEGPYISWGDLERKKSSHYTAFNTSHALMKTMRAEVLNVVSQTASDRFIEALPTLRLNASNRAEVKRKRFMDFCVRMNNRIFETATRDKLNAMLADGATSGPTLSRMLRSCGVIIPPQDSYVKHNIRNSYEIPTSFLQMMCLVHNVVGRADDTGYRITSEANYHYRLHSLDARGLFTVRNDQTERERCPSPETIYSEEMLKKLMAMKPFDRAMIAMPTPPAPRDEETREHDCDEDGHEFNETGYCSFCDAYDGEYDQSLHDEEEESHDEVPF